MSKLKMAVTGLALLALASCATYQDNMPSWMPGSNAIGVFFSLSNKHGGVGELLQFWPAVEHAGLPLFPYPAVVAVRVALWKALFLLTVGTEPLFPAHLIEQ